MPKIPANTVGAYRIRPQMSEYETDTQTNQPQNTIEQVEL